MATLEAYEYWREDAGVIYCADCLEILPLLPDNSIDLVLTDPPYGIRYETARRSQGDTLRVPIAGDTSLQTLRKSWPVILSKLRNDRHWYSFMSPRMIEHAAPIFTPYKHIIAWDKGDRGTVGDLVCYDWSSILMPIHPTVKPLDVLLRILKWSSNDGYIILDPFAGSGTMLLAAKQLGRKFIGIEIEEKYCAIAKERLSQEVLAL